MTHSLLSMLVKLSLAPPPLVSELCGAKPPTKAAVLLHSWVQAQPQDSRITSFVSKTTRRGG
jgi:hypothetical protein